MRLWNIIRTLPRLIVRQSSQTAMSDKRIAVCQMTSVADKEANLNIVSQLVHDAAKDNAQMLFFPEACDFICDNKKDIVKFSEPILGGATVDKYRELAAQHNVWLSMGGLHEKDEKNPSKVYNTHVIINNKGDIVQTYRKLHLFDVDIPEKGIRLMESDTTSAGDHVVTTVDTPLGKVGMSICYDLRFPELSTTLASQFHADILTFPSAFTYATGLAHWHVLLRARAIENQCYVVAAAQFGQHNPKRRSYGHAICIDPWGEVIVDCKEDSPKHCIAEISDEKLFSVRRNMPVNNHRRRDVYQLYTRSLRSKLLPEHDTLKPFTSTYVTSNVTPETARQYEGPTNTFGHVKVPVTCVFYTTKLTYAFVNLRCVIPGHVLVAPLRQAERNKDLTEDEADDFFRTVRLVQKLMERVHNTESCTVTIQDGPDAGQTVKHLHCHIMPRKKGDFIENDLIYLELARHDQFKGGHPAKPARTLQEMESEAKLLRSEMRKMIDEDKLTAR